MRVSDKRRYGTAPRQLRNIYIGRSRLREPGALHISPIEAGTLPSLAPWLRVHRLPSAKATCAPSRRSKTPRLERFPLRGTGRANSHNRFLVSGSASRDGLKVVDAARHQAHDQGL